MVINTKPELLILNRTQFGYHLDTYYYCKLAGERLRVVYVGFDTGKPKLHLDGVTVKYMPYKGRRLRRYLTLLTALTREVRECHGAIFIEYFPGCSVLRYMGPRARMIVDIRTGSVHQNPMSRRLEDWLMRWESYLFRSICVVSQSLADRLHLPPGKTHILPLGAERMTLEAKSFTRLDFLYVGTLHGRRIEDTVVGFERFQRDCGSRIALTYTIIGAGHNGELEKLRRMVHLKGLDDIVRLPGYVHKTRLQDVFDHCNVGISYVPINDTYDCQPVTKTFEYIFAGMPVIATATTENRKVIRGFNGTLIPDTPEGFYCGLKDIYARRHEFDSQEVRHCCPDASWDRIVNLNLVPYIEEICQS